MLWEEMDQLTQLAIAAASFYRGFVFFFCPTAVSRWYVAVLKKKDAAPPSR
jgi:hypothetical protein